MLFVSLTFLFLFLPIVLGLYYILREHRSVQNILLFLVSLFFYAWGEPKYVIILVFSIICNWLLALLIDKTNFDIFRKIYLIISIVINVGVLFIFKYLNFFVAQINRIDGISFSVREIALPIGISFFTFQALSYVIDVYRGEKCQRSLLNVGLYISFLLYPSISW